MNHAITAIIIPAYEPDQKLVRLVRELADKTPFALLIVNDGSGPKYDTIFHQCYPYAEIIEHTTNKGKGAALKTAYAFLKEHYPSCDTVITADADGQHKVSDIIRLANTQFSSSTILLGCRKFSGKVPFRSSFGNQLTKKIFRLVSGTFVSDTQTGLRAFHTTLLSWMLSIEGDRYEYEMNVLLEAKNNHVTFLEVPIDTVYIDDNETSHFNPVKDSFKIYKQLLKFFFSSFASFLVDFSIYSLMLIITGNFNLANSILICNITARCISSIFNFYLNKKYVFKNKDSVIKTALKYFALVIFILAINTTFLTFMINNLHMNKLLSKILVECIMFLFNWSIQHLFIFQAKESKKAPESEAVTTHQTFL